jgi:hypothetical protein
MCINIKILCFYIFKTLWFEKVGVQKMARANGFLYNQIDFEFDIKIIKIILWSKIKYFTGFFHKGRS